MFWHNVPPFGFAWSFLPAGSHLNPLAGYYTGTTGSLLVCHIQRPSRFTLIFWFTWCPSLSVFHSVLQPSFPCVLHKTFFDSAAGHHSPTPSTALRICNFYLMLTMLFCDCRFFSQQHSSLLGGRVKPSVFLSPCLSCHCVARSGGHRRSSVYPKSFTTTLNLHRL